MSMISGSWKNGETESISECSSDPLIPEIAKTIQRIELRGIPHGDNRLTDEEVWLRCYCAEAHPDIYTKDQAAIADAGLEEFRKRWRKG